MTEVKNIQVYGLNKSIKRSGLPMMTDIFEDFEYTDKDRVRGENLNAYECSICHGWHVGKPFQQVRTKMAFKRLENNG